MGWHRDLKINYDDLNGIYNEIKSYIDALTDLQTATSKFVSVINEQEGDAFVALSEECKDVVTVNNTDLIKTLQEVYDNLGGYMTDMQAIIAPKDPGVCRVDRNDIWWNKNQIKDVIDSTDSSINVPSFSYMDAYVDPDAENADDLRADNERKRRCRENNYNKLVSFKNNLASTYVPNLETEMNAINNIYENYVVVYENTDDAYAAKMEEIYDSIKTWLDVLEDYCKDEWDGLKGFCKGGYDTLMGLLPSFKLMAPLVFSFPLGMKFAIDGGKEVYQGTKAFLKNPEDTIGAMFQGMFDTADEEGYAFTAGYATEKVAEVILAKELSEEINGPKVLEGETGKTYFVDPNMFLDDEAAGVLRNGVYIKNPTAHNIYDYICDGSNYLGSKKMNGKYMYVVDLDGNIIIGTRCGQRMPHPTLVGGQNPQVRAAGMMEVHGGKIYSINNSSGHFKPGVESLKVAEDVFGQLPKRIFSKDFLGYIPFGE